MVKVTAWPLQARVPEATVKGQGLMLRADMWPVGSPVSSAVLTALASSSEGPSAVALPVQEVRARTPETAAAAAVTRIRMVHPRRAMVRMVTDIIRAVIILARRCV